MRTIKGGGGESDEVSRALEREILGGLFQTPSLYASAAHNLTRSDFNDPRNAELFRVLGERIEQGRPIDLISLFVDLEKTGELAMVGGVAYLSDLEDHSASPSFVPGIAKQLRCRSLERRIRELYFEAGANGADPHLSEAIAEYEAELTDLYEPKAEGPFGLSGQLLENLRERDEPVSPFPGFFDALPSLHVLSGKPKTGKTTLSLHIAKAWCQGVSPWDGAPALPGTRALILSAEQPALRLDITLRSLDACDRRARREVWTERLTIVARDPDLPAELRAALRLDAVGLARLEGGLERARAEDDPFGLVILDSLSRLKDPDCEENSNDDMTRWLDTLQQLAERQRCHLLLIHHQGHAGRDEARSAGRGASAIGGVAQGAWLLEDVPDDPRSRILKVQGNALPRRELILDVCAPEAEAGLILFFRPTGDEVPSNYIEPGERITTSELARRLAEPADPGGFHRKKATALRHAWQRQNLVIVSKGPRNSDLIELESGDLEA